MGRELLLFSAFEMVLHLHHFNFPLPVVPGSHDAEPFDQEAGADLDAVVLEDGHKLLLGEYLSREAYTLRTLLSEPCWSSVVGDFGSKVQSPSTMYLYS